jgi:uncharacterized membrane protein required for colicin V production
MIDVIAIGLLVVLAVRGWSRGFVRQALDVLTLILGAIIALRLAPVVGRLLTSLFGWSPEPARVVGGTVLFIAMSVAAGFASSAIHRSMRRLPGTSLVNSLAGAALGAVYALVIAIAAVTLLSALPLPKAVASELAASAVAERVVDPGGPAQRAVEAISGDHAVQSMIWLRRIAGEWLFVPSTDAELTMPVDGVEHAHPSSGAADALAAAIDRVRGERGLSQLAWSDDLDVVAVTRAGAIYRTGSFTDARPLNERLDAAGIVAANGTERLLLAPTIEGVERAIDASGQYDQAGIGVVDGPYGLLTVLVLTRSA